MARSGPLIGVIGPDDGGATGLDLKLAAEVGRLLGARDAVLVCGGLGGVMAAASRAAQSVGGLTLGLLPGPDPEAGNEHLTIALPTGLGELRNGLLVNVSQAVISIGGSWGTLNEIALAVRTGKTCVALNGWTIQGEDRSAPGTLVHVATPEAAVEAAVQAITAPGR